jgi:hypothetical protein
MVAVAASPMLLLLSHIWLAQMTNFFGNCCLQDSRDEFRSQKSFFLSSFLRKQRED